MNKTLQKAIGVEYAVVRTPLALLERQVVARLDEHSPVRTAFERGLGTLDAAAARLLGTEHEDGGPPAAEVDELAEQFVARQEAEHNLTGELADDEELRRVQAELRAKHQLEEGGSQP